MSQRGGTVITAAALLAFLIALSGCANPEVMDRLLDPGTQQIPASPAGVGILAPGKDLEPSDGRTVVIGRIKQVENGTELDMHSFLWHGPPIIYLYRVEDGQWSRAVLILLDKEDNFYWLLPKGTYLIARYYYSGGPRQLQTAFQVVSESAAVYIGTLRIDVDTDRKHAQAVVQDEFEQGRTAFETRNPRLDRQVAKQLMVRDVNFRPAPTVGSSEWHLLVEALRAQGLPILTTAQ